MGDVDPVPIRPDILAQTKADTDATDRLDEIVYGPGAEGLTAVPKTPGAAPRCTAAAGMQGTQARRTLTGLALPRAHDDCRHRRGKVVHAGALALQAKHAVDPAVRRRGRRRAEVKEPQDTAVENADLYRAADNAAHAITCIDSAMQSKLYWCIAERKRAFLHSNGTFRQIRMDAAPVPRRIPKQIRLAMCPPPATSGAGASLCNIARTVPATPMSLWLRSIRERRLMTSFVRMSVENKVSDAVRKADA